MDSQILKFWPIIPSKNLIFNSKKAVPIRGLSNTRFRVAAAGSVQKSEEEWRAILSPDQFRILRQKGTEYVCCSYNLLKSVSVMDKINKHKNEYCSCVMRIIKYP